MYHKKHQNRPPSKDQFHGVIEELRSIRLAEKLLLLGSYTDDAKGENSGL